MSWSLHWWPLISSLRSRHPAFFFNPILQLMQLLESSTHFPTRSFRTWTFNSYQEAQQPLKQTTNIRNLLQLKPAAAARRPQQKPQTKKQQPLHTFLTTRRMTIHPVSTVDVVDRLHCQWILTPFA